MNRVRNFTIVALIATLMFSDQVVAEVINLTEGSTSGYVLTNGNTYVVQESVSFSNSEAGGSGMTVEAGATVVIYVPNGVTLTATGSNGSGRTGGGAGIRVPETSTLIITGEGKVNVSGGSAGKGEDGQTGGSAYGWNKRHWSGKGGAGGAGGGGAGASIGGTGGQGGLSGEGANSMPEQNAGNMGWNGGRGDISETMGSVYILGRILINSYGGEPGTNGVAGTVGCNYIWNYNSQDWYAGGGGGGGGGGAGSAPRCLIGSGGQSGGGGGGGGSGSSGIVVLGYVDSSINPCGEGGGGGGSKTSVGESGGERVYYGGYGGFGADYGAEGGAGDLYVSSTAVVDVDRDKLTAETHTAAQCTIVFDANGGMLSYETNSVIATIGCAMPDCIPAPNWHGYLFRGWKDGDGTEYYSADGTKMFSSYTVPSNIVLYAEWVDDPDALVITPAGRTIFESSLTVSMSRIAGGTIHYTMDGSTPTAESPIYTKKFRIYGKTTIKAVAFDGDGTPSETTTAEYAMGACENPIITPSDGKEFYRSGLNVSVAWDGSNGVLRVTTDGSEPTNESPEYAGPFTVDETATIKAKVFSDTWFDSAVVTATLTREWMKVEPPEIIAAQTFTGSKNKVAINCATDQAVIYYTMDGSEPTAASTRYEQPFCVTDSCTIKAVALRNDFVDSNVETMVITRQWSIGETMGKSDHTFTTSGEVEFVRVDDATAALGVSMRSGTVKNSQTSILSTVVVGPGELSFKWKTSCEEDYPLYEWDHAEFVVDGDVVFMLDGMTDWQPVTHPIAGDGEHVVEWKYVKDEVESEGEDCLWVSEYSWQSDYTATQTTETPVPYSWLEAKCSDVVDEYDSYEKVAKQLALNGRLTVEQCYVAGVDPESATNDFRAVIKMVDGVPKITWDPDLKGLREYQIWGKATLDDSSAWQYPTNALHRFFKVMVEMP